MLFCPSPKDARDVYRRIDALATSLKCGVQDGDIISLEHQKAITALARCVHLQRSFFYTLILTPPSDVKIIEGNLGDILQERQSRFKRFFSAKRHRSELQDVVNQLEMARSNYTVRLSTRKATLRSLVMHPDGHSHLECGDERTSPCACESHHPRSRREPCTCAWLASGGRRRVPI